MTKPKTRTAPAYQPGFFSEPVAAWKQMRFEPQIVVDKRTGRFETDFARQQRIREAGGWGTLPWAMERAK